MQSTWYDWLNIWCIIRYGWIKECYYMILNVMKIGVACRVWVLLMYFNALWKFIESGHTCTWFQVFREIFDEDNYHPIQVETPEEYHRITEVFPYHDLALEQSSFPKRFPFSLMVPKVYRQVKNYVAACLEFSEDLNLRFVWVF